MPPTARGYVGAGTAVAAAVACSAVEQREKGEGIIEGARVTEEQIESILRVRRRAELFGEVLFSDPAWDILLELLAAELVNRRVGLADLASVAPKSSVARWVAVLAEKRPVICDVDPLRPDQFWIALSSECSASISDFLSGAPRFALGR